LLGPSGCGKTTLLRVIAGLEQPDKGDVLVDGHTVLRTPVHARGFGLMFQDYALFPHMTVAQNVGFGLKMRRMRAADQRIREMLSLVGLSGFEQRDVMLLSGGERQRVALARSLAPGPRLLMLDEPLGALDATLRDRLIVELREIIRRVGLTAIYVTHDQGEAFAIADRVAIMNAGMIEQVDTPENVYRRPVTEFAARFLGLNNIVPVLDCTTDRIDTPLGEFMVSTTAHRVLLHPIGLRLTPSQNGHHSVSGTVRECIFRGDSYRLVVEHSSGIRLSLSIPPVSSHIPCVGQAVNVAVDVQAVIPLCDDCREAEKTTLQ
jgi:ABC-type Fe3+/spermidine/putrescine transport system ATPase subunit